MFNKSTLLCALFSLAAVSVSAQDLKEGYINTSFSSGEVLNAIDTWTSSYKLNDDDHFYVSRIKSKARFRNTATQVKTTLTDANDKRLLCWLPWGNDDVAGNKFNALPKGKFDNEIFSMWSYVDHWGDWNGSLARVPAALTDVAHKNGVAVSGVAGIPQTSITSNATYKGWYANISEAYGHKAAPFLFYYGLSGMGYNSEFVGNSDGQQRVIAFHKALIQDLRTLGDPNAENIWYDGTNDNGSNTFDSQLNNYQGLFGTDANPVFSVFLNYNSMITSALQRVVDNANSYGRSSLYAYGGLNMQGGNPSSNWANLKNYAVSIGLWGAHSSNMFFQQRYQNGTAPAVQQRTYLLSTERWFGGGYRNPVRHQSAYSNVNYSYSNITNNPGMCSMMSARSSLQWNLSEEPFVTFFNLGNGTFFNWKGVRANDNEWTNVGVQDYLPTWRFWFHNNWLGKTTASVPSGIDAQFVWDDAYVGGSCLEISGTTSGTFLHLFKTKFALQNGDKVTLRYKLLEGTVSMDLCASAVGDETNWKDVEITNGSEHFDQDKWVEKTFTVGSEGWTSLAGKEIAVIALHFNSLTNAKIYLGELSIVRGTPATPAAPNNLTTTVLYNGQTGIDAKLIWDMPGKKTLPTATFNLDVNTSLFKLYAQVDDQDPVLMGITQTWAGIEYRVPTDGTQVRFGVSAVSTDFSTESAITWSNWYTIADQTYTYNDDITTDKGVIKPEEEFTISYVDPNHEPATWEIKNGSTVVKSGTGKFITTSIDEPGIYDLVVTGEVHSGGSATTQATTYPSYVIISPWSTGSVPKIKTLTLNDESENVTVNVNEDNTLKFTARDSDGSVSQGVRLNSRFFGGHVKRDFNITASGTYYTTNASADNTSTYTLTFWFKPTQEGGFVKVVDPAHKSWPQNNWGVIWSTLGGDGSVSMTWRGSNSYNYQSGGYKSAAEARLMWPAGTITYGAWQHVALIMEYGTMTCYRYGGNSTNTNTASYYAVHPQLYVNGVRIDPSDVAVRNGSDAWVSSTEYRHPLATGPYKERFYYRASMNCASATAGQDVDQIEDYLVLGGSDRVGGLEADVDHVAIWNKVLSEDEIAASMGDITSNLDGLNCLFTFDNSQNSQGYFPKAYGSFANARIALMQSTAGSAYEGQNILAPTTTELVAGYPMLSGSADVETMPTWKVPGADISNASVVRGTSSKTLGKSVKGSEAGEITGQATVNWPTESVRDVTLTLTNDYGTDSKTITAVQVEDPATGIEDVVADQDKLQVVTAQDVVIVRVPEAGDYQFVIYATNGRIVGQKAAALNAGQSVTISLPNQGVYLLGVKKDGKTLQGYKFIRE